MRISHAMTTWIATQIAAQRQQIQSAQLPKLATEASAEHGTQVAPESVDKQPVRIKSPIYPAIASPANWVV